LAAGLAVVVVAGCGSEADRVKGTWRGTLDIGKAMPAAAPRGATLRLVWHFDKQSDGTLSGTMDSPEQGANGIALDTVTVKDGAVNLQLNRLFASFDGQVSKDYSTITGQWKQGPVSLPLTMQKE
jgi:hypothetical protein